jgi:hypothetical protein
MAFEFVLEHGSVDVNGNAIMDPTKGFNRTDRKQRKQEQIQADKDPRLQNIFQALLDNGFSLRGFLLAAFDSSHEMIKNRVSQFYAEAGPAAIVQTWGRKLESIQRYDATFTEEIINVIRSRIEADLEQAIKVKSFRHPANSICRKTLRTFSLDGLLLSLERIAPHLTNLLGKLVPEKPGSVRGWRPGPSVDATVESVIDPYPRHELWNSDSDSDSDSDSNATSDSDIVFEVDSEWEDETDVTASKDPNSFVVTVGSILLYMKSQQSNCFQMIMGKYVTDHPIFITTLSLSKICITHSSISIS